MVIWVSPRVITTPTWRIFDAKHQDVETLARALSRYCQGKHKPNYDPTWVCGDYCVVVNARWLTFSDTRLWDHRKFYTHTGTPRGFYVVPAWQMHLRDPTWILRKTLHKMLPRNKNRKHMHQLCKIYEGPYHPHHEQFRPLREGQLKAPQLAFDKPPVQ